MSNDEQIRQLRQEIDRLVHLLAEAQQQVEIYEGTIKELQEYIKKELSS